MEPFSVDFWFEVSRLIVESLIVILLAKTVKDYAEVGKVSKIQAKQRFRPWVGPSNSIHLMQVTQDMRHQFVIILKNFGETSASSVVAKFAHATEPLTKDVTKSEKTSDINLGPLLPNMEKHYWFFIDSDLIEKAKNDSAKIFIYLYFMYEYEGSKSGYGLISRYDPHSNSFIHTEMWVD